ncbi:hypothetical protein [Allokutzneria oryzae]|uniref:Lactococcin 972 family bacteriocin n=1 Tax=Allokutzneria oryzae TaxID=1378989 RepID=A0ABV5ZV60_9PSEU
MNTTMRKAAVVASLFAAAMVVGPAAQASATTGDVTASETQTFHATATGSDKKRSINKARESAYGHAAAAGYVPATQCVVTHSSSSQISVGFWWADVFISCTRP